MGALAQSKHTTMFQQYVAIFANCRGVSPEEIARLCKAEAERIQISLSYLPRPYPPTELRREEESTNDTHSH